jgi:hypothetical protein
MFRHILWTVVLIPLLATAARANSITTYGVIITALGNDLEVQPVDKAGADAATTGGSSFSTGGGSAAGAGSGESLLVTPNGSGGIVIQPFNNSSNYSPITTATPPSSASGGGAGGGGVGSGATGNAGSGPSSLSLNGTGSTSSSTDGTSTTTTTIPVPVPESVTPEVQNSAPGSVAKTPEPASVTLLALAGVGGIGYIRRRRQ